LVDKRKALSHPFSFLSGDKIRVVLCDRDPSVMAASLCLFLDLCKTNTKDYKDLIPSFVSILKQVAENRLPHSYEYHTVPAPWIQINLLKILGVLGANDQSSSEHMFEVLQQVMQKTERHKNNAGFAGISSFIPSSSYTTH
jgi:AP-4 complex subunit epsilon-1